MTLWGGRFGEEPTEAAWDFTVSRADRRLLEVDVIGSLAHVAALGEAGILEPGVVAEIEAGLDQVLAEARSGSFPWQDGDEDVHSAVERRLGEIVGRAAGALHTGRSRNDQVALDLRLYLTGAAERRAAGIRALARVLVDRAEGAGEVVVPFYTHLQQAQAVPLAHHLLAHAWALVRDAARFEDALARIAVSPLGAGAGGGSRLPLRPDAAAGRLGLPGVFDNSLDAVGSRDAAAEYLWCCTQTMADLSRLAEEVTLWATAEFGWVTLADRHATGSSALPHKKNPDVAELVRGKAGSAIGHLAGLLAVVKGLPLAYDRDLQQDKEHLFAVDDDLAGALAAMAETMAALEFHPPAPGPWTAALDLAEVLVGRGVPFREAHRAVGAVVAWAAAEGRDPAGITDGDLQAVDERFADGDAAVLDPAASVAARRSPGGGSFASVEQQIEDLRRLLG
ncbi:MAG: argininosuccinate lyase [Actinobacteria bacterium]|nr:argininosuccinate lyase [Actinomycetota bacterium]